MTEQNTRTAQQQKAIEVYCRELAAAMNSAGYEKRAVMAKMKEGFDIPWSQDSVKDDLFRTIMIAVTEKWSTKDLEPAEVSKVYEILNRWTSQELGVSVLFPDARRGE